MSQHSLYEFIKLGQNLAQIRNIASVSIMNTTSLVGFPNLEGNQPQTRCSVKKTVDALRAIKVQLADFGLTQTLAALEPLNPMLAEMETALSRAPAGEELILRDHFADKLVAHAMNILLVLKDEAGAKKLELS